MTTTEQTLHSVQFTDEELAELDEAVRALLSGVKPPPPRPSPPPPRPSPPPPRPSPAVLFFGVRCGTGAGHCLHSPTGHERERTLPEALQRLDGVWTSERPRTHEEARDRWMERDPEEQGRAFIHYVGGWTLIAWWDRSEDRRGGCNANFLAEGRHTFDRMMNLARGSFPREVARMEAAYPIRLAGPDLPYDGHELAAEAFFLDYRALHPDVRSAFIRMMQTRLSGKVPP